MSTTTTKLLHHDCDSSRVAWAKYSPGTEKLYLAFKSGSVYAYDDVPRRVFDDLLTAKASTTVASETTRAPIGGEKHGSEGSFLIYHVIGSDRKNPPYRYQKLTTKEAEDLHA